jgi:hypothetical protein
MGKFRSNLIPKGKPAKTEDELVAMQRSKIERMVILSDRARSKAVKVSLPTFSWEKTE